MIVYAFHVFMLHACLEGEGQDQGPGPGPGGPYMGERTYEVQASLKEHRQNKALEGMIRLYDAL